MPFSTHVMPVAMYGCSGKHTRSWLQTLPDGQKLGKSTVTGPIWDSQKTRNKSMSNGVNLSR